MEPRPNFSESNATALATLNEKVDSLATSVQTLADIVRDDRKEHQQTTKGIYEEITSMRDRVAGAGRITWPLIVTTFTAALAFAAIVGGLGSYALQSETGRLNTRVDGVEDRAKSAADKIEANRDVLLQQAERAAAMREWQRLMEPLLMHDMKPKPPTLP